MILKEKNTGKYLNLPNVNYRRRTPKLLSYTPSNERQEYDRSSLKTLAWVYARLENNDSSHNQKVPAWSAFQELSSHVPLEQVN